MSVLLLFLYTKQHKWSVSFCDKIKDLDTENILCRCISMDSIRIREVVKKYGMIRNIPSLLCIDLGSDPKKITLVDKEDEIEGILEYIKTNGKTPIKETEYK